MRAASLITFCFQLWTSKSLDRCLKQDKLTFSSSFRDSHVYGLDWSTGVSYSTLNLLGGFCGGSSHEAELQMLIRAHDPSFIPPGWNEWDLWPGPQGTFVSVVWQPWWTTMRSSLSARNFLFLISNLWGWVHLRLQRRGCGHDVGLQLKCLSAVTWLR